MPLVQKKMRYTPTVLASRIFIANSTKNPEQRRSDLLQLARLKADSFILGQAFPPCVAAPGPTDLLQVCNSLFDKWQRSFAPTLMRKRWLSK